MNEKSFGMGTTIWLNERQSPQVHQMPDHFGIMSKTGARGPVDGWTAIRSAARSNSCRTRQAYQIADHIDENASADYHWLSVGALKG